MIIDKLAVTIRGQFEVMKEPSPVKRAPLPSPLPTLWGERIAWLKATGVHENTLAIAPMRMEAPAHLVWERVKDINHYKLFSHGLYEARMVNGAPVETGNLIELGLHPHLNAVKKLLFGSQLAKSVETIEVDDVNMALSWRREVPLTCGALSERWQIVVPRGPFACDYYSGLYTPGFTGKVAMLAIGLNILACFQAFADGIKK